MWWGTAPLDQAGTLAINRLVHAATKHAAKPQAASMSDPCKVHVGGVPGEAREDTLFTHFAAFEPKKVSVSAKSQEVDAQGADQVAAPGLHIASLPPHPVRFPPLPFSQLAAGKSFAFITFATPEQAKRAIRAAPTMPFQGHTLSLDFSKAR